MSADPIDRIKNAAARGVAQKIRDYAARKVDPKKRLEWWVEGLTVHSGNLIEPLIDGEHFGASLLTALRAALSQVFLTGWVITPWFPLERQKGLKAKEQPRLSQLIGVLSVPAGARRRVLMLEWRNPFAFTSDPSTANSRRELRAVGIAIRGTLSPVLHQKTVIIDSKVAFCGGMDVSVLGGDRWDTREHLEGDTRRHNASNDVGHWHDVQVRLEGPIVAAIERNFAERWSDAPPFPGEDSQPEPVARPTTFGGGSLQAQLLRTITPPETWAVQPTVSGFDAEEPVAALQSLQKPRPAAENREEYSTLAAYGRAIANARHFIYIENQYLTCGFLLDLLGARLKAVGALSLIILIPNKSELHEPEEALATGRNQAAVARFIAGERVNASVAVGELRKCAPDRVFVGAPINAAGKSIYVHAKLMIVDDYFATVGSANFSDRSMYLKDLELGVAWVDPSQTAVTAFRRDLWHEHLRWDAAQLEAKEKDAKSMAALWKERLADPQWKPKRIMEWSAPNAEKEKGPVDSIYPW